MKHLFFISFLFGVAWSGVSQTNQLENRVDSLWNSWTTKTLPDTIRAEALQLYAYEKYSRSMPDSARYWLRVSLDFAIGHQLKRFEISAMNEMGETFIQQSKYDSAIYYFNIALTESEKADDIKGMSSALTGLGNAYRITKNFDESLKYHDRALKLSSQINNISGMASCYNNIGVVYRNKGDYQLAIEYLNKSIELKKSINEKTDLGTSLTNLGLIYKTQGDFVNALIHYEAAFEVHQDIYNISGMATALNGMGNIYKQQGNYPMAIKLFKQAEDYFSAIGNLKFTATVQMNIGAAYHLDLKYDSAFFYYNKSMLIYDSLGDKNGLGIVYTNLGTYFTDAKNFQAAIDVYNKSIQLKNEKKDQVGLTYSYLGIAYCYYKMDSLTLATDYVQKALLIGREIGDTYIVINSFSILHRISLKINDLNTAVIQLYKLIDLLKAQLDKNYFSLNEQDKELYFATMEKDIGRMFDFSVHYSSHYKSSADSSFNLILQTKGLTLKSSSMMRQIIFEKHDSALLADYEKWIALRKKIAEFEISGKNLDTLQNEARELEKDLIKRSGAFADFDKINNLNWRQVRDQLKEDEAAIEFVHFKSEIDATNPIIYAAFVVRPESEHPEVVKLCTEEDLRILLGNIQGNNLSFIERVYGKKSDAKKDLYEKIWQPLEPYLQNVKTVYYSPSGLLHKVSFAAICKDQDVYLSDVYNFRQMGSTGNLAFENKTQFGELENFLLMGGVEYQSESERESEKSQEVWSYLPGSLTETDAINAFVKKKKFGVNYFNGQNASEEIFKEKITSSSIVHIATHGFFFPDPEQVRAEMKSENESGNEELKFRGTTNYANWSFVNNKNPLMRSGIVLANANDVWSRDPLAEGEDGILTAQEVSNLDLRNTKLVVLSACETGLGDIKGSEGVFGLQRAFKMAGVKYLIMSLWQVPDKETSEFMILFYKNLIKLKDIPTAFNKTQKVMREKYDPYYWGAFVLIE